MLVKNFFVINEEVLDVFHINIFILTIEKLYIIILRRPIEQ